MERGCSGVAEMRNRVGSLVRVVEVLWVSGGVGSLVGGRERSCDRGWAGRPRWRNRGVID